VPDPDDDVYERKVIDERRVTLGEVARVGPSLNICMTSASAGSMTCYWKQSCYRRQHRHIRRASAANVARPQKMWVAIEQNQRLNFEVTRNWLRWAKACSI
jgi:hypothetical protein